MSQFRPYSIAEASADELSALSKLPTREINVSGVTADVPVSLAACFDYLLSEGIVEGIFRVSGSVRKIKEVKGDYSNVESWLNSTNPKPLPRDVSGVLKRYTRDYFQAIGGLFTPVVLTSMLRIYNEDTASTAGRPTSFGSDLPPVTETEQAQESACESPVPVSDSSALINSISELLASKNSSFKNSLFIYYLQTLSKLAAHHETTKMTCENFSILFQQHIFNTPNLAELPSYQGLLSFLIAHFDSLAATYARDHQAYGHIDESEIELDSSSAESTDSPISSPLTECFSNNQSTIDSRRRSSISNRLSSLWDSYNMPVRSSKRLSFFSRSSEKLPSEARPVSPKEHMPTYEEMVKRATPQNLPHVITNSSNLDEYGSLLSPSTISPSAKLASSPSLQSISEKGSDNVVRPKLVIPNDGYFGDAAVSPSATPSDGKTNLSANVPSHISSRSSLANPDRNASPTIAAISPLTPPASSPMLPKHGQTIDESETSQRKKSAELKPSFRRRLSVRLRMKSVN